jgi:aromatic ring-opening dioxygenase catalytic subunit (LigB family)
MTDRDPPPSDEHDRVSRRKVLAAALGTAAVAAIGAAASTTETEAQSGEGRETRRAAPRMPVLYIPHGGGPWPFVELGFGERREIDALAGYLRSIAGALPARPRAMLVISAHWEAAVPTVLTAERPPLLYDYYGFPPEAYRITWPAPGDPALAARVQGLLGAAGIESATDDARGFDHGTFVPLKLTFPDADVPTIQLSLARGLDPARHLAIGRALAPLRDEGVLIVGSGMSYHDMRGFGGRGRAASETFDAWLRDAASAEPAVRADRLTSWSSAPAARQVHPREEHLLPLMVIAGAAGSDRGRVGYSDTFAGVRISAYHYGA